LGHLKKSGLTGSRVCVQQDDVGQVCLSQRYMSCHIVAACMAAWGSREVCSG